MAPKGMVFQPFWSEIGYRFQLFWSENGYGLKRPGARFSKVPVTYRARKVYFKRFFADYTVITDMVLGQCFHRIVRFQNLVFKANKN